ncbi:MAG: cupredoxin domain-containing protein [Gemmatimonadales bacterium]
MRLNRVLALTAAATTLACSEDSTAPANPCDGRDADFVVNATDNLRFEPATLTIAPGQTVCWQNRENEFHTVTSDDGTTFNSNLGAGAFFVRTFGTAGSFPYHCIPHLDQGMVGTVTVQ